MARLPNSEQAILDIRKLEDYCLDLRHPRGRHKARLFDQLLGLKQTDALWLRGALLDAARVNDAAVDLGSDAFGRRWRLDVALLRHSKSAVVRTIWIVRTGEDVPRFVTCWVI
jgi:hypothetical protein